MKDEVIPSTAGIRRYDIDWLRVIAMWMLIGYHISLAFQPFAPLLGFIQNDRMLEYLWPPLQILNIWRIPLLFFVSGMGVFFAMRRRKWFQLLGERSLRILLPLLYGSIAVVPLHLYLLQKYNGDPLTYYPFPGHLWFLVNIFLYVVLLLPVFLLLRKFPGNFLSDMLRKCLVKSPWFMAVFLVPVCATAAITNPDSFAAFALSPHGFVFGLVCFLQGFFMVSLGDEFWSALNSAKYWLLALAAALYLLRLLHFGFEGTPNILNGLECVSWVLAIFGFGRQFLNRPGKLLAYLSAAVYPTYIFHMFAQHLGATFIFPLKIAAELKLVLLFIFTFAVCYAVYEILRRIKYLRPLIGLRLEN